MSKASELLGICDGYDLDRNRSTRAVSAEEDNIFPRKEALLFLIDKFKLSKKEADFLLDWGSSKEWHHHGSKFRKVRYYDLSTYEEADFLSQLRKEADVNYKNEIEVGKRLFSYLKDHPKLASLEFKTDISKIPLSSEKDFIEFYLAFKIKMVRDPRKNRSSII